MNLTFTEQDVVELLIFQPRSVFEVAGELEKSVPEIRETLERLPGLGLVSTDTENWSYDGGPISGFFNYSQTNPAEAVESSLLHQPEMFEASL